MPEMVGVLFGLFVIFAAAKLAAEVFERLDQPAVIGELLAGAVIGPYALGLIGVPDHGLVAAFHGNQPAAEEALALTYHVVAELGAIVLLFFVGIETRFRDILAVGGRAFGVAVLGVAAPFALGFGLMGPVLGHSQIEALFLGTAMVATSVGITARVLRDLGVIGSREARVILGAAVIDDILAMVLVGVVSGLAASGEVSLSAVAVVAGQALAFTAVAALLGTRLMGRYGLHLDRLQMQAAPLAVSLLVMLGFAALAAAIGLAPIIGAFLAGMVLAEAPEHFELEQKTLPIYQFLVPFFFVLTGSQVDWRLFLDPAMLGLAGAVTALAVVGKLAGCGAAMAGAPKLAVLRVGVGMVPRGEVGLIIASLGLSLGAIQADLFGVVVMMSILTTVVAPPLLRALYHGDPVTAIDPEDVASPAGRLDGM